MLAGQTAESNARAEKYNVEAELAPKEAIMKYSDMNNDGEMDKDFDRKMRLADLNLKDRDMKVKEKQANDNSAENAEAALIKQLTGGQNA